MIVLSNNAEQTVATGQPVAFNQVLLHTGCGECYRNGAPTVHLKSNGIYEVQFSANVADDATTSGELSLVIKAGDIQLPETNMKSTPASSGEYNNIFASTAIDNKCRYYNSVTVINLGPAVTIDAGVKLFIQRRA